MGTPRDWLRFLRAPLALTAAGDSCACLLLALAAAGRGPGSVPPLAWATLAATSLLVYAFGMGANDLADRRRDLLLAPDRPLPSGAVSPRAAALVLLVLAVGALWLGGGPAGEPWAVRAALLFAVGYDFLLKRRMVPGALGMGAVRFANASTAAWPLVASGEAPWTVLLAPAAIGLYASAVSVLSTTEEVPSRPRLVFARWTAVAAFGLAALAAWLAAGFPTPTGLALAATVGLNAALGRSPRPAPPKMQVREMLLGLYFLEATVGSAADRGSLGWGLGLLLGAFAAVLGTQLAMRFLARR